ncbi:MAG: lipoate--protein ligase LplA, partial [candidate division Zixibacteria bacterium]|nr:lipoate--protein ligase LplA [candidate division Zixibacteria bacterium]NIX59422.1 lipoate--protein ligase LplA [candidate division Zixibacteria bacterium]
MVIISPYTSVYDNLAFEDLLFSSYRGDGRILLLYINDSSVVIGRFQNPWAEADLKALKAHQCSLARRISGGGTVYHDRGN